MLTMNDPRAEIKGILGEELESLRQRIIETIYVPDKRPVVRLSSVCVSM